MKLFYFFLFLAASVLSQAQTLSRGGATAGVDITKPIDLPPSKQQQARTNIGIQDTTITAAQLESLRVFVAGTSLVSPKQAFANPFDSTRAAEWTDLTTLWDVGAPTGASNGQVLSWNGTAFRPANVSGGSGDYARVLISGDVIDLSAGLRLAKTLSANWTPTIINPGNTPRPPIELEIDNPGNWTVTWPGSLLADGGTSLPAQSTGGRKDVYQLRATSSEIMARRIFANIPSDTVRPTVTWTTNNLGTLLLGTFSEQVRVGTGGSAGFTLTASGGAVTATYSSGLQGSSAQWTLSRAIFQGETLTAAYTQPGDGIEDISGNDLLTFSGATVQNLSEISDLLVNDDFNGTGTPSGWTITGTGVNFDATSPAMEGAQFLSIPQNFAGSARRTLSQSYSEIHGRFFITPGTFSSSGGLTLYNASNQIQAGISFRTGTAGVRMEMGTGVAQISKTLVAGNNYTIFYGYKAATSGSNGEFYVTIADGFVDTRPTLTASTHAAATNGSSTGAIASTLLNVAGGSAPNAFDKFMQGTSAIANGRN